MIRLLSLLLFCSLSTAALAGERTPLRPLPMPTDATDFTLEDMDGERHRLSDYRGRVVVINFWATWCPPCRREMPSMQRAWEQLQGDDVVLLAVDVGEDEETIFGFTGDFDLTFPILLDRDGKVVEQWPVRGLPSTYVVAPDGRLAFQAIGGREWDDETILRQIRSLRPPSR